MKNEFNTDNNVVSQPEISNLNTPLMIAHRQNLAQQILARCKTRVVASRKLKKSLLGIFFNLSITNKLLISLIASELVSILGIGIVGKYLISSNLQTSSLEQAKSAISFADIIDNIKNKQMGFNFQGNSDNPEIIRAISLPSPGQIINRHLKVEIKKIIVDLSKKNIGSNKSPIKFFRHQTNTTLVRETPGNHLNKLLGNSWTTEFIPVILALVIISIWVLIIRRSIMKLIQELEQTANKFATSDRSTKSEVFATDEVKQLALTFNDMANNLAEQVIRQENEAKLAQTVNEITSRFRGSLNTLHILNVAVTSTREAIKADRVIVYRFDENWYGTIIAESVGADWPLALGAQIADPCFAKDYANKYQKGLVQSWEDIHKAGLTECHLNQLEQFAVKANLIAPILINNKLYGLLIAHQCSAPRQWQDLEIKLLKQVAIPVGYALEQTSLLEQVEAARSRAEVAASEQRQQNEALQQQILHLLRDIAGVSQGDLTVRSEVKFGELGTVADFFNSIVENLRVIVTKVKVSANQVNTAIGNNEAAIRQLTDKALKQANNISLTVASVNNMTLSMQAVAEIAEIASQVAHNASLTVEDSEAAMDITVKNILRLRSTIGDTAKKVKRLGESSQQISHVVSLISQIATQTNLLAINAGLEATKAGEESEGFAIIAKEIGELAVCCTDATQEIEQIVEKIQLETSEVIKAMEQGTTQVVEGSRMVGDAKIALSQILNVSHQIDELVQSVSQMTLSQVETSQAVSKLMQEISQVSEFTSTSSRWVSQSLQQTVEISQELQKTVETFKVS
ncbi:methyl-accepting chemotaxis protein [Calothrix sp. PCC 7507]|uniref:methyl-accepting chemotaxis protein n=1 Tax=Calothrix sp. PCC 7507 TaxID=99598 RepID=UPI00029EC41C|nr:methyl-accepting chemotaxis protein [Calothrix sp. PCC 7507]AFY34051.1 methyl-accepting chemotaxis sensory transducer with GAF sensor [Calothrix sp. PCC 7507]